MENTKTVEIYAEVTPNPNTLKFNVSKTLLSSGSLNYTNKAEAQGAILPQKLFEIENVIGVMIGPSFVTVTKAPASQWPPLVPQVTQKIKELLSSEETLFPGQGQDVGGAETGHRSGGDSEIEKKIIEILDSEIRPAVAMDGGDITFYGYEKGVVTLHLQGSCSHCPSSIMTLKMGVENRLRQAIPEIREVVQV